MDKTMHPFIMDLRARTSGISKRIVLTDGDDRRALTAARYLLSMRCRDPC